MTRTPKDGKSNSFLSQEEQHMAASLYQRTHTGERITQKDYFDLNPPSDDKYFDRAAYERFIEKMRKLRETDPAAYARLIEGWKQNGKNEAPGPQPKKPR
jgi:hypothetical protein